MTDGYSDDDSDCMFTLKAIGNNTGARLGLLRLAGRTPIATPHYIADTSRGAVPHLAQDVFISNTHIKGVYVAIEDFIEKAPRQIPPILTYETKNGASRLRRFIAQPDQSLLVLGPRRARPVKAPMSNTTSSIPVYTSVGFSQLPITTYVDYGIELQPDIVVGIADIPLGADVLSKKRSEMMTDRSPQWISAQIKANAAAQGQVPALFAPVLPLPVEQQRWYLDELASSAPQTVKGLALYESFDLGEMPEELRTLPKLAFTKVESPHALLRQIAQGVDLFTLPFIGTTSDAGIALDFFFPGPKSESEGSRPLGIDMWSETHAVDLGPLSKDCTCYACTNHHRAYLRHLLSAKEMLAWGLLQIHDHHVMDLFFASVRSSIERGTFDEDCLTFERTYDPLLPEKTGQGPRLRGYQYRSEGPGEVRRNKAAFNTLDDIAARAAESESNPASDVPDIASTGFAEKL